MIYDEYADYTKKYKKEFGDATLVLIEIGSFWEIYDAGNGSGANMKHVADVLNIQVSKKNKNLPHVDRTNPLMAGFPSLAIDKFLPLLVQQGYTVVMVGQVTPPPNPKRAVVKIVSPGTYIGGADGKGQGTSNWIAAVYEDEQGVGAGVSLVDLATGKTAVYEAYGKEADLVLENLGLFYSPCEVVVFGRGLEGGGGRGFKATLDLGLCYDKSVHAVAFQNQVIASCFENETMLSPIEFVDLEKKPLGTVAFTMMLCFCKKHNERITHMLSRPATSVHSFLVGNAAAQIDLAGVEKLLNKCVTAIGRRYFKQRLFTPFLDRKQIEESWAAIGNRIGEDNGKVGIEAVRKTLQDVYDVQKLFRRCVLKSCGLEHLFMLKTSVAAMGGGGLLDDFFKNSLSDDSFKPGYNARLDAARDQCAAVAAAEEAFVAKLNANPSVTWPVKLEKSGDAVYISVTPKRWKDLGGAFKGFRVLSTGSSAIKITCPELESVYDRWLAAESKLKAATADAIADFCEVLVAEYKEAVEGLVREIELADFYSTCALNALDLGHVRPTFAGAGFKATALRHPLIETLVSVPYVPNDVELSGGGMLLYGLNAAGKSSLLKSVGLAVIMSHAGMYVACGALELGLFDSVFCRISKSDDMYSGKSTFMVEMSELRGILRGAGRRSMVLADELCAGTEHKSALAIVAAACRTLSERGVAFVFTTHLHELVDCLGAINLQVWHLDVYFDQVMDALVYNRRLKPGQGSQIYGLEVCKSLDMDADFIKLAFEIRDTALGLGAAGLKATRYNAQVFSQGKCAACGSAEAKEQHHILHQARADPNTGLLDNRIPVHAPGNLAGLCAKCHDMVHAGLIDIDGYVDTGKGRKLLVGPKNAAGLEAEEADRLLVLDLAKKMTPAKIYKELKARVSKYKIGKYIRGADLKV